MPVKMTSGKEIRQGLVEYGDWVFIGRQVGSTGATTTAIPDATRLRGLALPSTLFNNSIVRITSGAQAGERTYVDYLDPNSGILYLNPALSTVLADGDEYGHEEQDAGCRLCAAEPDALPNHVCEHRRQDQPDADAHREGHPA